MKLADLTAAQLRTLAAHADTSVRYLQNIIRGRRQASVAMAASIEAGARRMGLDVGRETLCATCKRCPHFRACRGPR